MILQDYEHLWWIKYTLVFTMIIFSCPVEYWKYFLRINLDWIQGHFVLVKQSFNTFILSMLNTLPVLSTNYLDLNWFSKICLNVYLMQNIFFLKHPGFLMISHLASKKGQKLFHLSNINRWLCIAEVDLLLLYIYMPDDVHTGLWLSMIKIYNRWGQLQYFSQYVYCKILVLNARLKIYRLWKKKKQFF